MAQGPQLLYYVADIQREDRLGEQGLQIVLESLGAVQFLVDRPVQFTVGAASQRVHYDDHHFLAVLAFIASFPAFLAAPRLAFGFAAMTLATAGAITLVTRS